MAFHDYHAREGNTYADGGNEQQQVPEMTPLNMDLVPPLLCHSFGIPMHDGYYMPQPSMYSYGYGSLRPGDPTGYPGQYLGMPEQHSAMGYGCLGDPSSYSNQGYSQARMYPYHPAFLQQRQRQLSYPPHTDMYNAGMYRQSPAAVMDAMCRQNNAGPMSGYEHMAMQQQQQHQHQQQTHSESRGHKRSAEQASLPEHAGMPNPSQMDTVAIKRTRLVWTTELHQRFEEAVVAAGGIDAAVPKTVLELMGIEGLTRDNVASHLQKHRIHLKKSQQLDSSCKGPSRSLKSGTQTVQTTGAFTNRGSADNGKATTSAFPVNTANFLSAVDSQRGTGESFGAGNSGEGTSGTSGNGNSKETSCAIVELAHCQGSHRLRRDEGKDLQTSGNTGTDNSNGTGPVSSQVNADGRTHRSHNDSNGNSNSNSNPEGTAHTHEGLQHVDVSNRNCGQSTCEPVNGAA